MSGRLRIGVVIGLVMASLPLAPGVGQSQQEALSVYENWSGARIRGDRWRGGEVSNGQEVLRELRSAGSFGNYLAMSLRREGETDINTGTRTSSTFLNIANPASVAQIEALMGVLDVLAEKCPTNPTQSEARLVIAMTAFNDGSSSGAGDRKGDYNALVQAVRRSNSSDQAGILRVEGRVTRCRNAACGAEDDIVAPKDLGVIAVGAAFTMRLIWDAPNNQFLAGVNNASVALPYTASDTQPAVQRSVGIEIRTSTANCVAGATEADLEAGIGPVSTSGSPPVVTPTPPPPPPPPPTPPTPPPTPPTPPVDDTPFVFPTQPPYNPTDPSARYTSLGPDPATGENFYVALPEYANPLIISHLYAGLIPDGRRLWVPRAAQPSAIRRALQTGTL
jgi:hypothetical protein